MSARRIPRAGAALALLAAAALVGSSACQEKRQAAVARPRERVRIAAPAPERPLDPEFLMRGLLSLKKQLGSELQLLELQAVPFGVSLQLARDGKVVEYVYEESPDPAEPGKVFGPTQAGLVGQGELERNVFPLGEIDVDGISKSFDVARRSVDPDDGQVERVIVRRFFPFGEGVRARVYVYSPRMSGAIDTNPNGVPLRR